MISDYDDWLTAAKARDDLTRCLGAEQALALIIGECRAGSLKSVAERLNGFRRPKAMATDAISGSWSDLSGLQIGIGFWLPLHARPGSHTEEDRREYASRLMGRRSEEITVYRTGSDWDRGTFTMSIDNPRGISWVLKAVGVRFDPDGVRQLREKFSVGLSPSPTLVTPSVLAKPKRVSPMALREWWDAGMWREETITKAWAAAKAAFPENSVPRSMIEKMPAARTRGPRK